MEPARGRVDLVGAGPGDPALITVQGREALARADVVVYDALVNRRLLDLAPAAAERIFAGRRRGRRALPQAVVNALLTRRAREGRRVVRLKGGDPFVFGRGAEELESLEAAGVPVRVVPGVTAGVGALAYAGLSPTHREAASGVAFVTGHADPEAPGALDWPALARFPGTLVIYMGMAHLAAICRVLVRHGKLPGTPAAVVQQGTTPRQRTIVGTLADLPRRAAEAESGPPALVVVGDVVRRRQGPSWFERLPLFGRRVLITRPVGEAGPAADDVAALGAEALIAPMVRIEPPVDYGPLDRAIAGLAAFDWLVFTSLNGVHGFLDRLAEAGRDLRALGHLRLAAIGPATAEALARRGLRADVMPAAYRSEALAEALSPLVSGCRVLLARADRGRPLLREALERVADVEQVAVYRNLDAEALPAEVAARLAAGTIDWVTLTSPAIAARFFALLPEAARSHVGRSIRMATISPVTSAAVREHGFDVAAETPVHTWPGLLDELRAADRGGVGRPA
jgi:uroporphyrinogen III methyltransferase/synthase